MGDKHILKQAKPFSCPSTRIHAIVLATTLGGGAVIAPALQLSKLRHGQGNDKVT
jgi:hypothetical protein